ncbi:MAG: hypothetical protein WCP73_02420 [Eubacteriales bacterium]
MSDGAKKALSIIGLILGILSILLCATVVFSMILAIVGLVFAILTIKGKKGMAIATIILCVIGIIASIVIWPLIIGAVMTMGLAALPS